jgi:uncharacterized protein YndB with AHSA1/START domain
MVNRTLNPSELAQANSLLSELRQKLEAVSCGDELLLWALRRKIFKELTYDERGKPTERRKLKEAKWKAQRGICSTFNGPLPEKYCVLDWLEAMKGYTSENTQLICVICDTRLHVLNMPTKNEAAPKAVQELVISRAFDVPRELVFNAWTDPEFLMRWYAPRECTINIYKLDFRPGGLFHTCIQNPDGHACWCKGIYREIVVPERIVFTLANTDEKGNVVEPAEIGMDPEWPRETTVTVTFTEHDRNQTKLMVHQTVLESIAKRTGAYASWLEMLDQLAEELAKD